MLGVLVEAFAAARAPRRAIQLRAGLVALAGRRARRRSSALAADRRRVARRGRRRRSTGPTLFMQGTDPGARRCSACLLIAERWSIRAGDAFAPQGVGHCPARAEEQRADPARAGCRPRSSRCSCSRSAGMLLFPAANDLLTMFVALEVLSLPLYLLCGLARRRRLLSQEAALKYFLLGAFSSAFFLYGVALLYGFAGSVQLRRHRRRRSPTDAGNDGLLLVGIALLAVGLLFKVGAVPFHTWTPDVYQGAPDPGHRRSWPPAPRSPRSARCCGCSTSALGGTPLGLAAGAVGRRHRSPWSSASVLAVTQTDIKRMLAYSSIAHAGFILIGVLAIDRSGVVGDAVLPASPTASPRSARSPSSPWSATPAGEATHLSQWAGLGKRLAAGRRRRSRSSCSRSPASR